MKSSDCGGGQYMSLGIRVRMYRPCSALLTLKVNRLVFLASGRIIRYGWQRKGEVRGGPGGDPSVTTLLQICQVIILRLLFSKSQQYTTDGS